MAVEQEYEIQWEKLKELARYFPMLMCFQRLTADG